MATTLGLDIGAGALKLVLWDGQRVRKCVNTPVPDNMVKNGQIVSYEAMGDFLKETLRRERIKAKDCAVLLPASLVYLRRVSVPAMSDHHLQVNLPYEFRDFLDQGKDKYFYDYIVNGLVPGEGGESDQLDLTAAAVPKAVIEEYRFLLRRAGLKLKTAIPAECAYANLLRGADQSQEYAILDLGHDNTRIHIFTGRRFEVTRVIETGLSAVDKALSEARGIDPFLARTHKEADMNGAQESNEALAVYASIAVDIRKVVNFYGFSNRQSDLKDLWCGGGGVKVSALLEAVGQAVDLKQRSITDLMPPSDMDMTAMAAALGAAMQ